ncbi:MAG: aminomethyl-transferring glycine dehydrogenase subunit GcvPA [Desulfocapsaceae bacterium]
MRYLPHTEEEIAEMLAVTGQQSLDELFAHIPADSRYQGEIDIPGPLSEWDLTTHMEGLGNSMFTGSSRAVLIGAGSYDHHIPEIVRSLSGRSEFLTAYTPYQPEMAQGTLQGIFEFQTLTARLLGAEVANASMYDGASALAEALLMALRIGKKKRTVAISSAVHPHYREVVQTYLEPGPFEIVELSLAEDGTTDLSALNAIDDLAGVAIQSPNFFGVIEDHSTVAELVHDLGALYVACFSEPLTFGMFKNPGSAGADIVCGEGQSFGMKQSLGGAGLGMFGCKKQFVRNMPGRVAGQTVDKDGKRGYVLTLSTREQHIRREKATSNICSNQGLCAMTAAIHMATLGRTGMRKLAKLNYDIAAYLRKGLLAAGARQLFSGPVFNEFAVAFEKDFTPVRERLLDKGIAAGLPLEPYYPDLGNAFLFCATETVSKALIDELLEEVRR